MLVDRGGDRRMRQLKQDGAAPAGDDDRFAVEPPADAARTRPDHVRPGEPHTHGAAMTLKHWLVHTVIYAVSATGVFSVR